MFTAYLMSHEREKLTPLSHSRRHAGCSKPAAECAKAPADRIKPDSKPHIATADDTGLLDALPIAAAIVEREWRALPQGRRTQLAVSSKPFGCRPATALDWNEADCLKGGPIAELLQQFFDGSDTVGELDFRDGEGIAVAVTFGVKLAPLPRNEGAGIRAACSPSSIVRSRFRPSGRLARRDAARQPDRPAQPSRLHRSDREGRRERRRAISSMRCWSSTCCGSAASTNRWGASPATNC